MTSLRPRSAMTLISPSVCVDDASVEASSAAAGVRTRALVWNLLIPFMIAVMTFVHTYRSPSDASGVEISPDEVEYAVGAQRLATVGHFDISIDGRALPSRYPPGFSMLLAPIYALWPQQIGAGIVVVQLFAVIAALAAFFLGRRLAGNDLAGVLASAAVVTLGSFDIAVRFIMTDVPTASLWLVLAWLFVWPDAKSLKGMLVAGLLIALAAAIRTTNLWLLFPFVLRDGIRKSIGRWIALLAPTALVLVAQALYQQTVFGSPMRSGYHVWCPIPYDFPSQVFSSNYIAANLEMLWVYAPILILGILGALILMRKGTDTRTILSFALAGVVPLSLMHLFYFTAASRFYLPLLCIAAILAGAGISTVLRLGKLACGIASIVVMTFVALMPPPRAIDSPGVAQQVRKNLAATPDDAIILTAQDLVWMEPAIRGSHRRLIPLTRAQEYASKRLAYQPLMTPQDWNNPAKAMPVVKYAVEDDPARIAAWLTRGRLIYLDVSGIDHGSPLIRRLLEQCSFHSVPGRLDLWQLGVRP